MIRALLKVTILCLGVLVGTQPTMASKPPGTGTPAPVGRVETPVATVMERWVPMHPKLGQTVALHIRALVGTHPFQSARVRGWLYDGSRLLERAQGRETDRLGESVLRMTVPAQLLTGTVLQARVVVQHAGIKAMGYSLLAPQA